MDQPTASPMPQIRPGRRLKARVAQVLAARGEDFVSDPLDALELGFDGVAGDVHAGLTRRAGGREPWYPRGTEMRNERQVSILAVDELGAIAGNMGVTRLEAGWLGANLVLDGLPRLSFLPARSVLMFEGGVSLRVDGYNVPCRRAGGAVARHLGAARSGGPLAGEADGPDGLDWSRTDMALRFVEAADRLRGLVAWVERPGTIRAGEAVTARVPEQWIYAP